PNSNPCESAAAPCRDFHYAALQPDRNFAKSFKPIRQQIYNESNCCRRPSKTRPRQGPQPSSSAWNVRASCNRPRSTAASKLSAKAGLSNLFLLRVPKNHLPIDPADRLKPTMNRRERRAAASKSASPPRGRACTPSEFYDAATRHMQSGQFAEAENC